MMFKKTIKKNTSYFDSLVTELKLADHQILIDIHPSTLDALKTPLLESEVFEYKDKYDLVNQINTKVYQASKKPLNILLNERFKVVAFHILQKPIIHPISTYIATKSIKAVVEKYGYELINFCQPKKKEKIEDKISHKPKLIDKFNTYVVCENNLKDSLNAINEVFPEYRFRINSYSQTVEILNANINKLTIQGDREHA